MPSSLGSHHLACHMNIASLSLTNFRNYRHQVIEPSPHLSIFYGDNGQGKTNLLEAIWILATTKSHRATREKELINHSVICEILPVARLSCELQSNKGNLSVEVALQLDSAGSDTTSGTVQKRIKVNGATQRASAFIGQVNTVMFTPQDIELIDGSPSGRRRHIDLLCSQIDNIYLRSLQQYIKVLEQRNQLLVHMRDTQVKPDQLEFWDSELIKNGSYVVMGRRRLISLLNNPANEAHSALSGGTETLGIEYLASIGSDGSTLSDIECEFRESLCQTRSKEIFRGMTLVGPHRDDLRFQVSGSDAAIYGSRGQQRSAILSLKLAEVELLRDQTGGWPILLLDDVLSELDCTRRSHLLNTIANFKQVFITTTDLEVFEPSFLNQAAQFEIRQGSIKSIYPIHMELGP